MFRQATGKRKKTTIATPNMRKKIFDSLGGRCAYCGCELDFNDFHIDHLIPLSKGGTNGKNRVPSCPLCNLCKHDLDLEDFRKKIEGIFDDISYGKVGLIKKYYNVELKKRSFYFEEVGWDRTEK